MRNFNRTLKFGRDGERVVAEWLIEQGYAIIRTADISVSGLGGPRVERAGHGFILPDLQVVGQGMTKWVEVKTKSQDVLYQRTGELRQGIERRNFNHYIDVQDKTGVPGYLAFLVLNKGQSVPPVLRMAPLDRLSQHGRGHVGNTALFNGEMIWWPIDIFDSWDIDGGSLVAQPPEPMPPATTHAWDAPRTAKPVARQNYLDFEHGGAA